ncbi:hypothetical protein ACFOEW_18200 [Alteromonas oceani]|uniref:Phage protein n=1 Tax=Alteromonas oceani TaxID=2071609 RepID=A0ABV7K2Z6_9ALTE|nr:hypothetical protein [Alteromonas oceani]MBL53317.1 hypothetical protein [Alteromonadaceae bacterium]|tara:strand:+ start:1454 stop:1738 length:285 start_codon:yes stop_codon:yes gene_type:complete
MKLDVEIISIDADPWALLTKLAKAKFRADEIHEIPGTDTLNVDNGMNDLRAKVVGDTIEFGVRYKRDEVQYEQAILDFCRENALTLRFNPVRGN